MPLAPTEEMLREAREALPELPAARIERYASELGLADGRGADARRRPRDRRLLRAAPPRRPTGVEPKVVANWVTGELAAALRQGDGEVAPPTPRSTPEALAALVALVQEKKISHGSGKTVLAALVAEGGDPAAIVEREGLGPDVRHAASWRRSSTPRSAANPEAAEQIRAGNGKAIGAIVGAVMRETKGRADGGEVNRLIREKLEPRSLPNACKCIRHFVTSCYKVLRWAHGLERRHRRWWVRRARRRRGSWSG